MRIRGLSLLLSTVLVLSSVSLALYLVVDRTPEAPMGLEVLESSEGVLEEPEIPSEGLIQNLNSIGLGELRPGMEACGNYFKYTPPTAGDKEHVGILFVVSIVETTGKKDIHIFPWGTDKFQIRVSPAVEVPRIKILHTGGPIYPWAEILISPRDFSEAPCLKHSKMVEGLAAD